MATDADRSDRGVWRWALLFAGAGFLALAVQVYLLREYLVVLQADETSVGLGLASWLAGIALGAPLVRLLSGGHRDDAPDADVFRRLHQGFNEVGAHAEACGVTLVIENHGGPTATGQRVARLMEGIESPAVGLNFDPANFLNQGTDPLMALRRTRQWVRYSHWKDVHWADGAPAFCAFGEGEIRWAPIIAELMGSGYHGYFGVEYEEPSDVRDGTVRSLAALRRHLAEAGVA